MVEFCQESTSSLTAASLLVPPSEFQTPVDLFASLSVKEIGRERVHCTMSQ